MVQAASRCSGHLAQRRTRGHHALRPAAGLSPARPSSSARGTGSLPQARPACPSPAARDVALKRICEGHTRASASFGLTGLMSGETMDSWSFQTCWRAVPPCRSASPATRLRAAAPSAPAVHRPGQRALQMHPACGRTGDRLNPCVASPYRNLRKAESGLQPRKPRRCGLQPLRRCSKCLLCIGRDLWREAREHAATGGSCMRRRPCWHRHCY